MRCADRNGGIEVVRLRRTFGRDRGIGEQEKATTRYRWVPGPKRVPCFRAAEACLVS